MTMRVSRIGVLVGIVAALLGGIGAAAAQEVAAVKEKRPSPEGTVELGRTWPQLITDFSRLAVEDVRREWDVKCNTADFDIYDSEDNHDINLTVSNKGVCPFTFKITVVGGAVRNVGPIPPNTPRTINRRDVVKIAVDCDGAAADACKASYTLRETD